MKSIRAVLLLLSSVMMLMMFIAGCGQQNAEINSLSQTANQQTDDDAAEPDNTPAEIIFCENIDNDLNVTGMATQFPIGQVYAGLQLDSPFNINKIKVTVFKIDGSTERVYIQSEQDISPNWVTFFVPITFADSGKYRVEFSSLEGKIFGSGNVETIQ